MKQGRTWWTHHIAGVGWSPVVDQLVDDVVVSHERCDMDRSQTGLSREERGEKLTQHAECKILKSLNSYSGLSTVSQV